MGWKPVLPGPADPYPLPKKIRSFHVKNRPAQTGFLVLRKVRWQAIRFSSSNP
jgi:hypothetical protein